MAALDFPPSPLINDKYPVPAVPGVPQYTFDGVKWTTVGPQITNAKAADAAPLMDAATAAIGTATDYAREDHVHPSDTSRAEKTYVDGLVSGSMVRYDAVQTLTAAQQVTARENIAVQKKNYIINGAMQISQENGSTAGSTTNYYVVDQFYINSGGTAVYSAQRVNAGSRGRIRVSITTADTAVAAGDHMRIEQRIEGFRAAELNFGLPSAKTITVQFGVKAPAGTYSVVICNVDTTRNYVAEYVIAAGEANTDTIKSVTVPGDITGTWMYEASNGLSVRWGLMAGTTFQQAAGAWGTANAIGSPNQFNFAGSTSNVFELFDVSLTEGTVAPPFVVPDYVTELLLCQRYYIKRLGSPLQIIGNLSAGANYAVSWALPAPMRAAPAVTLIIVGSSGFGAPVSAGNTPHVIEMHAPATTTVAYSFLVCDFIANARL